VPKTTPKKRTAAKKVTAAKKAPAAQKKPAAKKPTAAAPKRMAARADLGAPIDGFFAKQPPALRAIVDALRAEIEKAAPTATSSLKWGMPFWTLDGAMFIAVSAHKSHVNLVLPGPPGTYADPEGLLEGEGKTGKHLKVRSLDELPRTQVRAWLKTAVGVAKKGGKMR
jgi:hypothetical protein